MAARKSLKDCLGIIADDLTGALDTGAQLARVGLRTAVMLRAGKPSAVQVLAITTDSRNLAAAEAYRCTREAARAVRGRHVYKKVDSTLRGNLGAELDGVLDGLGLERALVAPAFPLAGRTTVNGVHLVHGVPLADTDFARDPHWPARESHLPTLLAQQTRRTVGHLPLSTVARGEQAVIRALREASAAVIAADAARPEDLQNLASALAGLPEPWLPCGSAGLAEYWPAALGLEYRGCLGACRRRLTTLPFHWPPQRAAAAQMASSAALVVAGSRHLATLQQLHRAEAQRNLHLINVPLGQGDVVGLWAVAVDKLQAGCPVALTTALTCYRLGDEMPARGPPRELAVIPVAVQAAHRLAQGAAWVCERVQPAGLVLTGGDTARAVCEALDASALEVVAEVQPGVPASLLRGGPSDGLHVVTKAGGFGDEYAIVQSMDFVRGVHCCESSQTDSVESA